MNLSAEPIIVFDRVTKRFGRRLAVEDASFQVSSGRTLGIVGESGSGKTTCVRLAIGLERPTGGTILWRGDPYPRRRSGLKRIRQKMGIVFQDPYESLDPRMSIGSAVAEPLRIHGVHGDEAIHRVKATLAAVGLPDAPLDSYPARYSGGGRQRIAIARALVLEPDVLICDEPTASLDVSVQAQIVNLLLDLKRTRLLSTIFVSHDLDLVHRVADDLTVMYAGRVVERGPAHQIRRWPRHPYTLALLSAVPGDHPGRRKLGGLDATETSEEINRAGCAFASRCPRAQQICRAMPPPLEEGETGSHFACFFPLEVGPLADLGTKRIAASPPPDRS